MKLRTVLLFASYAALTACGDTTSPSGADAAIDATPDVTVDATLDTADVTAPDVTAPDAPVNDIARTDAASDRAAVDVPLTDAPPTDAGACNGANPGCVSGTAGGTCGDAISQARCVGSAWQCEAGAVFPSQCACVGRPPGACTCGPSGWICDAGTPPDASGCSGSAPACASGTAGGTCGDALSPATCSGGGWRCGEGMVLASQCACIGRPPGACTCGPSGWICDAGTPPDASALVDCDPSHVACDRIPPVCTGGGEVASVSGLCWGPCVLYTRCMPIACDPAAPACPTNLVCYRTTRLCGPPL